MMMQCEREKRKHKVAIDSWKKAQKYIKAGNVGRACAHILVAVKLKPNWKRQLKDVFSITLCKWGNYLESKQRYEFLFMCYNHAVKVYPDNEKILNNLGAHFYRLGFLKQAKRQFEEAIKLRPLYVEAHKNLQRCLSAMVERWHFRMLNDADRNEAYREAVMKKVKQGFNNVLDIGTGTGLLSIFAVKGRAQHVHACDCSEVMFDVAEEVLDYNGVDHLVELIKMNSNDMDIPNDLVSRVSLVVTETMDAGLFGENLLQTLIHAWEHLLLPPLPPSTLLPPSPCIICTDKKLALNKYRKTRINGIVVPFGATLWIAAIECKDVARKYKFLHKSTTVLKFPFSFASVMDEPYDTENLQSCSSGYKFLSKPINCFYVNFNDPDNLKHFMNGKFDEESIKIEFLSEGTLDAFVIWFDLHLDEDLKLSSCPTAKTADTCCWDQAIFPSQKEINVIAGATANVRVKTKDGELRVELIHPEDLSKKWVDSELLLVSQESVRFLNNTTLLNKLHSYAQANVDIERVLDFSPFPFMGLSLAALTNATCCFIATCDNDITAVQKMATANGIPVERVKCFLESDFEVEHLMENSPFDLIVTNLIDPVGEISEQNISHLAFARNLLKEGGHILPQKISLWGQLVSSEWLTRSAEVLREGVVENYSIPMFMNKFKVSHQLDLNMASVKHTPLSEPFRLYTFSIDGIIGEKHRKFKKRTKVTSSGKVNALLYWFQYNVSPLNNEDNLVSSRDSESHVNLVAVLVEAETVKEGQEVAVICKYQDCAFIFKLKAC